MKRSSLTAIAMTLLTSLMMISSTPALASNHTVEGAEEATFGKSTSIEPVTVISDSITEDSNVDRSKNSQIVPPAFGSTSADTPGTGYLLTPNLSGIPEPVLSASPSGTLPDTLTDSTIYYPIVDDYSSYIPGYLFTDVSEVKRSDGSIGTLSISRLGVTVKAYEGETTANMSKGIGHFTCTSAFNGNTAFAGHNRGSAAYFGQIHTLQAGDIITYETKLGTKTYEVYRVEKISKYDTSVLEMSGDNTVTLITCVRDEPLYRWCVQALETAW